MPRTQDLLEDGTWDRVRAAFRRADRRGRPVLVALDFDGTLAPVVSRPDRVRVPVRTLEAIRAASRLRGVRVAAISARPLRDLARYLPVRGVLRVAQYGLEGADKLSPVKRRAIRASVRALHAMSAPIVARFEGAW